ncbi:sn-1-specific diacylglycerol lipase ABHD11 isoform X1 [Rhynchophorus ferrugineus]|uniref:sn-1-specific diacylglycerol lipase ABHD11 isoform X1 n=1 Tax=Rhynchophorus ferrugineus TaxID=354439 RepID=UPI003FCD7360
MFLTKNSRVFVPRSIHDRYKSTLTKSSKIKPVINLAYVSYQTTESENETSKDSQHTPLIMIHGIFGSKGNYHSLCKRRVLKVPREHPTEEVGVRGRPEESRRFYPPAAQQLRRSGAGHRQLHIHDAPGEGRRHRTRYGRKGGHAGRPQIRTDPYLWCLPDLVDKLIVTDVSPISTSNNFKAIPDVLRALKHLYLPKNLPPIQAKALVTNHLVRVMKEKGLMTFVLTNLVQSTDGSYTWRFNLRALLENFDGLASFPHLHNVNFQKPVLFIGGGKSDYIQKSDYPKILKLFPKAQLKYIEGAGHWVHSEKPNEFLKLTLDFLNRASSA